MQKKKKVSPIELYNNMESIIQAHIKGKIKPTFKKTGVVLTVQDGIVVASGLNSVGLTEIVIINKKIKGMVSILERDYVRICLMGSEKEIQPGDIIERTQKYLTIPVGFELLGRVVNSLGQPLDGLGILKSELDMKNTIGTIRRAFTLFFEKNINTLGLTEITNNNSENTFSEKFLTKFMPIKKDKKAAKKSNKKFMKYNPSLFKNNFGSLLTLFKLKEIKNNLVSNVLKGKRTLKTLKIERTVPGIMDRKSIHEPLITGTKVIDGVIPIGRGQRELILGDRNTGKTTIAIDAMISQARYNISHKNDKIYSVYVAIGQRQSKVQDAINTLKKHNAWKDTIVVFAPSYAPAMLQFIAPYSGTTIAEFFRDKGHHALVVYDDLTKHAQIHRQLSLLLKSPPGREAYPGDIFYVHARLLERSAKLSSARNSGSLTSLPVIETFDGDATSYIPTNVISITDGQIYLKQKLFFSGIKPAVDINFSVSRVGSAAQIAPMQELCGRLKLEMASYNDYKMFARFTSDLDPAIKKILFRGDRILELFKQKPNAPLAIQKQVISFYLGLKGFLDPIPLSSVSDYEAKLHSFAAEEPLWYPYYLNLTDMVEDNILNTLIDCCAVCKK